MLTGVLRRVQLTNMLASQVSIAFADRVAQSTEEKCPWVSSSLAYGLLSKESKIERVEDRQMVTLNNILIPPPRSGNQSAKHVVSTPKQ